MAPAVDRGAGLVGRVDLARDLGATIVHAGPSGHGLVSAPPDVPLIALLATYLRRHAAAGPSPAIPG